MGIDRPDTLDNYQIPITPEEFEVIKKTKLKDLNYQFLVGRNARVIHEGGIVPVSSHFALSRCGKPVKSEDQPK